MSDLWMREGIPLDPPTDPEDRRRMEWYMIRRNYAIALEYERFKTQLEAVVQTNAQFTRASAAVRLFVLVVAGLVGLFYGLSQALDVWDWLKRHF